MTMPTDHIRYDLLAQEALRGVVRRVLADVAKKGLPGEHHFYVTFDTRAGGVKMSPRLVAQHPEEMTIILQHQFWDLVVTDRAFEVGLSFNRIPERLTVPFEAIKGFFDPSVQFGLQFETAETGAAAAQPSLPAVTPAPAPPPVPERKGEVLVSQEPAPTADPAPEPPQDGGQVVRLDRFRKK
jgi:uncharacterized protein